MSETPLKDNPALQASYSHRIPTPFGLEVLPKIRQALYEAAVKIDAILPASREKSLCMTNLEQARMWACNAATLSGEIKDPVTVAPPGTAQQDTLFKL